MPAVERHTAVVPSLCFACFLLLYPIEITAPAPFNQVRFGCLSSALSRAMPFWTAASRAARGLLPLLGDKLQGDAYPGDASAR